MICPRCGDKGDKLPTGWKLSDEAISYGKWRFLDGLWSGILGGLIIGLALAKYTSAIQ